MKRRTALALCCAGFLSLPAFAGDEPKTAAGKLRCSLTGKVVDKCCCEPREGGKLHCTLADKDVEKCCCKSVEEKKPR